MRIILTLWFVPLVLFWGWYALSANDMHFGYAMLSRQVHDLVFAVYAKTLGVDADVIPGMIAGACAVDTAIIMAIAAFRWRASWLPQAREMSGKMYRSFWQGSREERREYYAASLVSEDFSSGPVRPGE